MGDRRATVPYIQKTFDLQWQFFVARYERFTWNITKQKSECLFKVKTGTNIFMLTLLITFWPHLGFPVNSSFNIFLPHTLKCIFIPCIFVNFRSCFWYIYRIFGIWIMDVLFSSYLILTKLYDTWDEVIGVIIKLGNWIAKTPKMSVKIGHKFEFEIFRHSIDE